jgi:hypothetical protein
VLYSNDKIRVIPPVEIKLGKKGDLTVTMGSALLNCNGYVQWPDYFTDEEQLENIDLSRV